MESTNQPKKIPGVFWLIGLALLQPVLHYAAFYASAILAPPFWMPGRWEFILWLTFLVPVLLIGVIAACIRVRYGVHLGVTIGFGVVYVAISLALLRFLLVGMSHV